MRRKFIKRLLALSLGSLLYPSKGISKEKDLSCRTGADVEGPFYRKNAPSRKDITKGYDGQKETLVVKGRVYAKDCNSPLANAVVDIWHASPEGMYDNRSNKFLFRGKVSTDSEGYYEFRTIKPGVYQSRPRHIHYKVRHANHQELTTQLYFENDKFLKTDRTAIRSKGHRRAMKIERADDLDQVTFDIYLG